MKIKKDDNLKFLVEVNNDVEACVIEGLLDSCNIKSMLKYDTDIGGAKVIIGKSAMPVSIYVNKEDYEIAKEIINSEFEDSEEN